MCALILTSFVGLVDAFFFTLASPEGREETLLGGKKHAEGWGRVILAVTEPTLSPGVLETPVPGSCDLMAELTPWKTQSHNNLTQILWDQRVADVIFAFPQVGQDAPGVEEQFFPAVLAEIKARSAQGASPLRSSDERGHTSGAGLPEEVYLQTSQVLAEQFGSKPRFFFFNFSIS